jgi:hypothetical protein
MKQLSKQQRTIAYVAGGLILAYLAYRWYASRQTASTTSTAAGTPNTSSSDYASLAGQEQADYAALQGQVGDVLSQEQSDVAGIQGGLSGVTATVGGWTDQIAALITSQQTLGQDIAALATGQQKIDRSQTHATTKGGAFYKYYLKVTGKPPPANIATSNFIYQGYLSGVSATGLKNVVHPSSKNTHVAHPNGNHQQQNHVKPAPTKPPPKTTKPKPSGTRK